MENANITSEITDKNPQVANDLVCTGNDVSEHQIKEPNALNCEEKTTTEPAIGTQFDNINDQSNITQNTLNLVGEDTHSADSIKGDTSEDVNDNSAEHGTSFASKNESCDAQEYIHSAMPEHCSHIHRRETEDDEMFNDVTSDIGDECTDSEEPFDENKQLLNKVYICTSCGWNPEMEKCFAHKSFQTGFSDGLYQHQGVVHGYPNYNFTGYTAGQRPGYPIGAPQATVDLRYNPNTNRATSVIADPQNQTGDDYAAVIQSLRRKTFCLSIVVIFLMFGVITLAILIS